MICGNQRSTTTKKVVTIFCLKVKLSGEGS
jgi:hypothetical protein